MDEGGRVAPSTVIDPNIEENIRQMLEGDLDYQRFMGLYEANGARSRDPRGDVESQIRRLHILNVTFKAVMTQRVIDKALEHLGREGHILHLPSQDPTFPYHEAVFQKGRLLTAAEYGGMLTSFSGLEILYQQAVNTGNGELALSVKERVKSLIPNKARVLARMEGWSYDRVLGEFIQSSGVVELVDAEQFIEFVAMQAPELQVVSECQLQLSRELVTLDNLLAMAERQRTPETRMDMVKEIMESAPKYHFVLENNMRSRAFYEAYPHMFELEDIARPMIKWKCDGECMDCKNWKKSLHRPGPSYSHM
jgi:hypothetical protein